LKCAVAMYDEKIAC